MSGVGENRVCRAGVTKSTEERLVSWIGISGTDGPRRCKVFCALRTAFDRRSCDSMVPNDRDGRGPLCNTMFQRESVGYPCSLVMSSMALGPQIPFLAEWTCVVIDALDGYSAGFPIVPLRLTLSDSSSMRRASGGTWMASCRPLRLAQTPGSVRSRR
ncbi:hypothetical protein BCEN4_660045 [Burkholderia cenocepacia]|nr:hypothetical protein BCEN4_660045 [Burkholderia cenocepacia]